MFDISLVFRFLVNEVKFRFFLKKTVRPYFARSLHISYNLMVYTGHDTEQTQLQFVGMYRCDKNQN